MEEFKAFLKLMTNQLLIDMSLLVFFAQIHGSDNPLREDVFRMEPERVQEVMEHRREPTRSPADFFYFFGRNAFGLRFDMVIIDRDGGGYDLAFEIRDGEELVTTTTLEKRRELRLNLDLRAA